MKDKNVPTTNNVEPQRPAYPAERKPAKGPLITTGNIEQIQKENAKATEKGKGKK